MCVFIFVTDALILPCPVASAVLVTASTEVDKTGASYYGEQTLHYLATNGDSAVVQLRKCPLQVYKSNHLSKIPQHQGHGTAALTAIAT